MTFECRPVGTHLYNGLINFIDDMNKHFDKPIKFVEVGSYSGESSLIFMNNLKIETGFFIDPWISDSKNSDPIYLTDFVEAEELFNKRLLQADNYIKMKMTSEIASRYVEDNSIDMVYIDAEHSYESVLNDIYLWLPKIKKGGIISGHDYYLENIQNPVDGWYDKESKDILLDVTKAVNKVLRKPDNVYEDCSWFKIV